MFKTIFLLCALAALIPNSLAKGKVVCYYESWMAYDGITPEVFDPNLCTHANYAFSGLKSDGSLKVNDQELDITQGLFKRVTDWKNKNKNLKVLLSVGGADDAASALFSSMSASAAKRAVFIKSANEFMDKYNFDGLDIDWEVPQAKDKAHFITLLKELRANFDQNGHLLTAAVASEVGEGYDVAGLVKHLHFINVMSYDMYGSWSEYTGQNSPLHPSSKESEWEKENLNVEAVARNWVNAGAPAGHLVIGVAFYGRSFMLADKNKHGIHAAITGPGVGEDGYVLYNQICEKYGGWTEVWDDEQKNPYKYQGTNWLGYDDEHSIKLKVNHINVKKYGGVMIWAIDGDDVLGNCGEKQHLLKVINNNLL